MVKMSRLRLPAKTIVNSLQNTLKLKNNQNYKALQRHLDNKLLNKYKIFFQRADQFCGVPSS